jgi:hypothetical protein
MEEILYSDLGIAIKEACKKLYHVKGRIKIMFYSSPPKFTPPLRPAMHDVYVNKGCYHFPSNTYYDLGQELEENVRFDPTYYMGFQNKIMRIFLPGHQGSFGTITRCVGRLIKQDYGKETQLRKEYREFMS